MNEACTLNSNRAGLNRFASWIDCTVIPIFPGLLNHVACNARLWCGSWVQRPWDYPVLH